MTTTDPVRKGATLSGLAVLVTCTLAACDAIPADPRGTTERVTGGTLRVGVIEAPPFVDTAAGAEPGGVESELVRRLAEELGARVEWHAGSADEVLEGLLALELDLAIGALVQSSPWATHVAMTRPWLTSRLVVGSLDGNLLRLEGARVAVAPLGGLAKKLREEEVLPVSSPAPEATGLPAAAPEWQIRAWGYHPTRWSLGKRHYTWAAPRGENRWVVTLSRFLEREGPAAAERLVVASSIAGPVSAARTPEPGRVP